MNPTAYNNWIYQQEEPDLVIQRGNAKRHKPIHNIFTIMKERERFNAEYIEKYGLEAWNKINTPLKPNWGDE